MDKIEGAESNDSRSWRGRSQQAVATAPPLASGLAPAPGVSSITTGGGIHDCQLSDGTIAVETNHASRLHALIIGINDYPNLSKLKGAVADADEIENFLTSESELKVPLSQIINLRNETATRKNIIDSFESLRKNPSINRGDPILIYYAGHGGLRKATEEWKENNGAHKVQVIFPYDYDIRINDSSDPIECIPDRTIAGLLNDLSEEKGDNVTVIFDSCHSASGTREHIRPNKRVLDRRERSAEVKRDIPWNIDSNIVPPELGLAPPLEKGEMRHTNLPMCVNQTSHIHLAACGSEERAWEEDGRGVFTMALLKSIRAHGVDKLTYLNLIRSLPSFSSQIPHCYGKHKDRILFNSSVPSRRDVMVPVIFDEKRKEIILRAGAASGVTTESVWEVYDSVTGGLLLGRFKAEPPHVSVTVLKPEETNGDDLYLAYMQGPEPRPPGTHTYARQVGIGVINDLRVYFTPAAKERIFPTDGAKQEMAYSYPIGSGVHDVGYVVHPAEDSADIAVDLHSEREVSFRLCDRQTEQYGVARLEKRVRADRDAVEEVLFGAAKWKWHLQRKNADSDYTTDLLTMELVNVGVKPEGSRERKMHPPNERKSMNTDGIADFKIDQKDLYGIKLTNQIDRPVHVRMFYFDTTDFSIVDMFGHTVGRDPVIDSKSTFMIGDNAKGGTPLQFTLNTGEVLDLGYLKVFWSTKPLELERIGQKPKFDPASRKWTRLRGAARDVNQHIEWGTALLTLVQRSSAMGE